MKKIHSLLTKFYCYAEHEYTMELGEFHVIKKILVESDWGLIILKDLKWVSQIDKATRSAKAILGQNKNSFCYFDSE